MLTAVVESGIWPSTPRRWSISRGRGTLMTGGADRRCAIVLPVDWRRGLWVMVVAAFVAACSPPPGPPALTSGVAAVAAGDIACDPDDAFFNGGLGDATHCQMNATAQTATLLRPSAVLALGDLQYNAGTTAEFRAVYDHSWGQLKAITHPVPGNHEHGTPGAAGYLSYFGAAAAPAGTTWYSFNLGSWDVVALDSTCDKIGGCGRSSPQGRWLAADLAANPTLCTLAIWHHPAFSSARGGGIPGSEPLWNTVVAGGVDLVLNGHRHQYERFAAMGARGSSDPARGAREIVVGTGGNDLEAFGPAVTGSEMRLSTFGVLELTLSATDYTFRFVGIEGSVLDQGNGACHT
jgi:hypothetical protein